MGAAPGPRAAEARGQAHEQRGAVREEVQAGHERQGLVQYRGDAVEEGARLPRVRSRGVCVAVYVRGFVRLASRDG